MPQGSGNSQIAPHLQGTKRLWQARNSIVAQVPAMEQSIGSLEQDDTKAQPTQALLWWSTIWLICMG